MINSEELIRFRQLGITKVELGVQSVDDSVLKRNKRGSTVMDTVKATQLLKDFGFKVSYQMMVNLYGSDYANDVSMFRALFRDERFMPDHLKIYPLALVRNSKLYDVYREGKYTPYDKETLVQLIADVKRYIPKYCRVERVIRDIPAAAIIEGGAAISNLRQEVEKELQKRSYKCCCIRCREVKNQQVSKSVELTRLKYSSANGTEYFLSIEDKEKDLLIGFCRLRLCEGDRGFNSLAGAAMIREIHVYGPAQKIGESEPNAHQHQGWGKLLVSEAEEISRKASRSKIAVIAGVGVRSYFRKLGYDLTDTYMVKSI